MEWFWNQGEKDIIGGLDIIGLRQIDQTIERGLVSGITTISFRARYLTLLPWAISLYYESKETSEGFLEINPNEFEHMLARLEFIILATTLFGEKKSGDGEITGMIGLETHEKSLNNLFDVGEVKIPEVKPGGALNTYIQPCRSFGIMDNDSSGIVILPRGKAIFNARQKVLSDTSVTRSILDGGDLHLDELEGSYQYFSVNGLNSIPEEGRLLREAMFSSFSEIESDVSRYYKFRQTTRWALSKLDSINITSARQLIQKNYQELLIDNSSINDVELEWFDYELHRRVHYALESMLGSFTDTLKILDGESLDTSVKYLLTEASIPPIIRDQVNFYDLDYMMKTSQFIELIPKELFLNTLPSPTNTNRFTPSSRLIFGFCLIIACWKQSREITLVDRDHVMEEVFSIIEAGADWNVLTIIKRLLEECAVKPHISNTLRKMQNGQQCSLRFYPEGDRYLPTGMSVHAGFSNDRLSNVVGLFRDMGFVQKAANSAFALTDDGYELLHEIKV
jgi:hypothetical protein